MRKKVILIGTAMLILAIFGFTDGLSIVCEDAWSPMINRVLSYVWYDMEEMAHDLPNATIAYRGSDTINSMNNSIICQGVDAGVGIKGFKQTNNVFPIEWSDKFYIGMHYNDLMKILKEWTSSSDDLVVESIADGDAQIMQCSFCSESSSQSAFVLKFYLYSEQVYQITFTFI